MNENLRLAGAKQRIAKPGEVYAFYVEMLGKYGVCQIYTGSADRQTRRQLP